MPIRFQSKKIKLSDLYLDPQNPRFVTLADTSQNSIISYLIKDEDVIDLARSIASYGGLMPGEFPIVCIENSQYIVAEGNRRTCACKILLDPRLAPAEYRASIPMIATTVQNSIKRISVHIVDSREDAQAVLGRRHIEGVKKWPSVSRFMFFAQHFEAGKSIAVIEELTGVSRVTITTSLRNHYFLRYILSLDCWTEMEKQNLVNYSELHKKGVDRILRIFRTAGSSELKITYNEQFRPSSALPDFGKIVEHIVRRVLNILPQYPEISTRTTFSQIRGDIEQWLPTPLPSPSTNTNQTAPANGMAPTTPITSQPGTPASQPAPSGGTGTNQPTSNQPQNAGTVTGRARAPRQTEFFFENLTYNITPTTDQDRALIALCEEIKKISRGSAYRQYPLSASFLTRALIEQTCKRYLRIYDTSAYGRLCPINRDSTLTGILRYFCSNPALFPDNNYHRVFVGLFPNGGGIKEIMDLNMHHPGLSMPTGALLEGWVSAGLKNLLEFLLH